MVKETKLYDILQVSTEAGDQEIRKAYKTLALKYHPDKQTFASAEEKESTANIFKSISYAYSILGDPNKRRLYDNYGEEVAKNPELQTQVFSADNHQYDHMNSQHYSDLNGANFHSAFPAHDHSFQTASNLFNQFFNDVNSGGLFNGMNFPGTHDGRSRSQFNNSRNFYNNLHHSHSGGKEKLRKGRDIHDNIYCSLLDYYKGEEFKLSLSRRIKCPKCKARGGLKIYTCNDCCGSGIIVNEIRSGLMYQRSESTCSRCNGTGEFIPSKFICDECGGNKLVDTKIILQFRTPRGVSDGYRIIFPNAADEGIDLIPGDVIITLRDDKQNTNTKFRRFGNNLLTTIPIPLVTVLCGGYVIFEHINGDKLKIYISRGDIKSSNQLKILKGFGMPIHKQGSSSAKSKKHRKKHKIKKNRGKNENGTNDSNDDAEYHTIVDNSEVQGKDSIIVTSTDSSSGDDTIKHDYGNLYIRFEIQLPNAKDLSPQQISMLGMVFGRTTNENFGKVSSLSATSSTSSSSDDDIGSLKMSSNYETSTSSLSKAYKSSESNSNGSDENIDIAKKKQTDDYVKKTILEDKDIDASNTKMDEIPMNESSSSQGELSDSNDANIDEEGNKIVFLQDLTDVDKVGLSMLDFPEAFNEKTTGTNNGDISASAEDKNKTAEVMDNSFSDLKPRQKKAKNRRFV